VNNGLGVGVITLSSLIAVVGEDDVARSRNRLSKKARTMAQGQ
jgi:hypothetical protein